VFFTAKTQSAQTAAEEKKTSQAQTLEQVSKLVTGAQARSFGHGLRSRFSTHRSGYAIKTAPCP